MIYKQLGSVILQKDGLKIHESIKTSMKPFCNMDSVMSSYNYAVSERVLVMYG